MKEKTYWQIGSIVDYARPDQKGDIHTGKGTLVAYFLNEGRLMAQVKDGETAWNCEYPMINASPEKVAEYDAAIKRVQAITLEGNEKVKDVVSVFNAEVDSVYEAVLGEKVQLETTSEVTETVVTESNDENQAEAA